MDHLILVEKMTTITVATAQLHVAAMTSAATLYHIARRCIEITMVVWTMHAAALLVRRRLDRADLIAVLKTRE